MVRRLPKETLGGGRTVAVQILLWVEIQTYRVEIQAEAVGAFAPSFCDSVVAGPSCSQPSKRCVQGQDSCGSASRLWAILAGRLCQIYDAKYSPQRIQWGLRERTTGWKFHRGFHNSLSLLLHLKPYKATNWESSILPHGVYTHLHILLHIIESKGTSMLNSFILDQAISLKELHRYWKIRLHRLDPEKDNIFFKYSNDDA